MERKVVTKERENEVVEIKEENTEEDLTCIRYVNETEYDKL